METRKNAKVTLLMKTPTEKVQGEGVFYAFMISEDVTFTGKQGDSVTRTKFYHLSFKYPLGVMIEEEEVLKVHAKLASFGAYKERDSKLIGVADKYLNAQQVLETIG